MREDIKKAIEKHEAQGIKITTKFVKNDKRTSLEEIYDAKGQKVKSIEDNGEQITIRRYIYDENGNRICKEINGESNIMVYNDTNQLELSLYNNLTIANFYTEQGILFRTNIIKKGMKRLQPYSKIVKTYEYDDKGRKVLIKERGGKSDVIIEYKYDNNDNVISKVISNDNEIIEERKFTYNKEGKVTSSNINGEIKNFTYNRHGLVTSVTVFNDKHITKYSSLEYNEDFLLEKIVLRGRRIQECFYTYLNEEEMKDI